MKTISLRQPWASWVIIGAKPIETRLHNRFAGLKGQRIGIHATAKPSRRVSYERTMDAKDAAMYHWPAACGQEAEMWRMSSWMYPFGAVLGTAFVQDTRKLTGADSKDALIDCESVQRYGLILSNIFKFDKPIPAKGSQGIWEWTPPKGFVIEEERNHE